MTTYFFLLILFNVNALALPQHISRELRGPAEHQLRDDKLTLKETEVPPKEDLEVSLPTSVYRVNETRSGFVADGILPVSLKQDWRVPFLNVGIHSASKASPSVDESGIYVGSDSSWFYAYGFDGYLRWRRFVPDAKLGIHGTAALDKHKVYFGAYNGVFYALTKKEGKLVWFQKLGDAIGASPVLYNGSLYISVEITRPPNGFVARLNGNDGSIVWKSSLLGEQPHSSPVIDEKNKLVHLGANNGKFFGLDMDTGQTHWQFSDGKPIKDTGVLIGENICFGTWSATFYCLEAATGKMIWNAKLDSRTRTSPTFVPDLNYILTGTENGSLYAFNLKDGSAVWRMDTGNKNLIASSVVIRDSLRKERRRWIQWTTCAPYFLCAIEAKSGAVLEKYDMSGELTSVPVFYGGRLYVSTDKDGGLERFGKRAK